MKTLIFGGEMSNNTVEFKKAVKVEIVVLVLGWS